MPFGAEITNQGVRFALWAPSSARVDLVCGNRRVEMPAIGQGWFKYTDAAAKAGERYAFAIDGDTMVPDPAARFKPDDADHFCQLVDACAYDWKDAAWTGRSWNEVVLYEAHIGTVSPEGTYLGFADKLPAIKAAGVTAIELMPIAETPGSRTWGYDGVLPFAPNNDYGTPDDLKRLVDTAHALGMMVFLDVVYNHFGPTGNFLGTYAKSFFTDRHQTPWGAGINFDGSDESSEVVREFFFHNALYWIEEFHIDGLRFDAVHAILDDSDKHFLEELAERIREATQGRHVHLVLENEENAAHRLVRDGDGRAISYDAQWDDDIHHCWHVLLTGEDEGYYGDFADDPVKQLGRCLAQGFAYQGDYSKNLKRVRGESTEGLPPQAFVAFLQNHDQVGNRAQGDRLTTLADAEKHRLARATLLLSPQIPMLFMGAEWGATTPFLFFVNFDDEALQQAIREGRAKEFEKFTAFSSGEETVPDPTAEDTFERSKLDWSETGREPHAGILRETTSLLALRHAEIMPLLHTAFVESRYTRHGAGGLEVVWRFEMATLTFVANFSEPSVAFDVPAGAATLWHSDGLEPGATVTLPAWTGLLFKSTAA